MNYLRERFDHLRRWLQKNPAEAAVLVLILLAVLVTGGDITYCWTQNRPLDRTMHRSVALELGELGRLGNQIYLFNVNASDIPGLIETALKNPESILSRSEVTAENSSAKRLDQYVSYRAKKIAQSEILPPNARLIVFPYSGHDSLELIIKDSKDGNRSWKIVLAEYYYEI